MRGFFARRAMRVVGVVALLVVVVAILFLLLNWYVAPAEPGASVRKDLVVAVAQILGGTALLSGLYFTWRTLQVNREGQITDRFTRAIDQLGKVDENGSKLFEIRVGGIYALERIARESEEDYWPIMEILTAYVQHNAPLPPEAGLERTEEALDERAIEWARGKSEATEPTAPDPDIQAIMTILRRRSRSYGKGEPESLDLSETNLSRADLSRADLSRVNLYGASLFGADLSRADFSEARLFRADLYGASLFGARLTGANLSGARLFEANLPGANLSRADLTGARLFGAILTGARLFGAILTGANLSGANLISTNLTGAQDLTQGQLEQTATGDKSTQLPPHLKPPTHWGVETDEQTEED